MNRNAITVTSYTSDEVPKINKAADLRRLLEPLDLPVPLPNAGRFA